MRSPRQKLYDHVYYHFERWLTGVFIRARAVKATMGKPAGKEFSEAFRTSIRPYWAAYGVRISRAMALERYRLSHSLDPRYIPNDVYITKIVPHFNPLELVNALTDKNLNGLLFPEAGRPRTLFRFMSGFFCDEDFSALTGEEALGRISGGMRCIIKPARDSSEGMDVRLFTGPEEAKALLPKYRGCDFIVQEAVRQHPDLARLNESSVNTIRVVTLRTGEKVQILSSILRVGAPGEAVDNIGHGGCQCVIRPDGTLGPEACYSRNGVSRFVRENAAGLSFEGYPVPSFGKAAELAVSLARHVPHLRLIAWDLAIDENAEPVLIEFNASMPSQNQLTCGPTFGDSTEEVLAEVFGRKA